jgi:hypothetical protein
LYEFIHRLESHDASNQSNYYEEKGTIIDKKGFGKLIYSFDWLEQLYLAKVLLFVEYSFDFSTLR